jgi:hypothetical protein
LVHEDPAGGGGLGRGELLELRLSDGIELTVNGL